MTFFNWLTIHWIIGFTFILIFCTLISSLDLLRADQLACHQALSDLGHCRRDQEGHHHGGQRLMFMLKKAWVSPAPGAEFFALSLESLEPEDPVRRLRVDQSIFPNVPSVDHPLKHVTVINLLDEEDLRTVRDAINKILGE